jgi:hypothetical protein
LRARLSLLFVLHALKRTPFLLSFRHVPHRVVSRCRHLGTRRKRSPGGSSSVMSELVGPTHQAAVISAAVAGAAPSSLPFVPTFTSPSCGVAAENLSFVYPTTLASTQTPVCESIRRLFDRQTQRRHLRSPKWLLLQLRNSGQSKLTRATSTRRSRSSKYFPNVAIATLKSRPKLSQAPTVAAACLAELNPSNRARCDTHRLHNSSDRRDVFTGLPERLCCAGRCLQRPILAVATANSSITRCNHPLQS